MRKETLKNPSWLSWHLKMEPTVFPETSVRNYHCTLRKIAKESDDLTPDTLSFIDIYPVWILVAVINTYQNFHTDRTTKTQSNAVTFLRCGRGCKPHNGNSEQPENNYISRPMCPPPSTPVNYICCLFARNVYIGGWEGETERERERERAVKFLRNTNWLIVFITATKIRYPQDTKNVC